MWKSELNTKFWRTNYFLKFHLNSIRALLWLRKIRIKSKVGYVEEFKSWDWKYQNKEEKLIKKKKIFKWKMYKLA